MISDMASRSALCETGGLRDERRQRDRPGRGRGRWRFQRQRSGLTTQIEPAGDGANGDELPIGAGQETSRIGTRAARVAPVVATPGACCPVSPFSACLKAYPKIPEKLVDADIQILVPVPTNCRRGVSRRCELAEPDTEIECNRRKTCRIMRPIEPDPMERFAGPE